MSKILFLALPHIEYYSWWYSVPGRGCFLGEFIGKLALQINGRGAFCLTLNGSRKRELETRSANSVPAAVCPIVIVQREVGRGGVSNQTHQPAVAAPPTEPPPPPPPPPPPAAAGPAWQWWGWGWRWGGRCRWRYRWWQTLVSVTWSGGAPATTGPWSPPSGGGGRAAPAAAAGWGGWWRTGPSWRRRWPTAGARSGSRRRSPSPRRTPRRARRSPTAPRPRSLRTRHRVKNTPTTCWMSEAHHDL